jgi:proteic killer suppression protein
MIKRFKNQTAEKLFRGEDAPELEDVRIIALRTLDMLQAANQLSDIQMPFERRLGHDWDLASNQRDIPLNEHWSLRFIWTNSGPDEVEIFEGCASLGSH